MSCTNSYKDISKNALFSEFKKAPHAEPQSSCPLGITRVNEDSSTELTQESGKSAFLEVPTIVIALSMLTDPNKKPIDIAGKIALAAEKRSQSDYPSYFGRSLR